MSQNKCRSVLLIGRIEKSSQHSCPRCRGTEDIIAINLNWTTYSRDEAHQNLPRPLQMFTIYFFSLFYGLPIQFSKIQP